MGSEGGRGYSRSFEGPFLKNAQVVVSKGPHAGERGVVTGVGKNNYNLRYVMLVGNKAPLPFLVSELSAPKDS